MESTDIVPMIQRLWRRGTDSNFPADIIVDYVKDAFYHVETFDYPQSNAGTFSGDDPSFSTSPSDASMMLYVYKALEFMQMSEMGEQLISQTLGINWKAGIDSVNTSGADKMYGGRVQNFSKMYQDALMKIRNRDSNYTIYQVDLYDPDRLPEYD